MHLFSLTWDNFDSNFTEIVPRSPNDNKPACVQIMAWRRPGDKPLSEPMMVCPPTHTSATRPQWVQHHSYDSIVFSVTVTTQWSQYIPISHKPFNLRYQSEWNVLPNQAKTSSSNYLLTAHVFYTRRPHFRLSCQTNRGAKLVYWWPWEGKHVISGFWINSRY